ncbi:MAG: VCBS repeat-containing protein [Holophagales bacterium]|nr:VCBS repeat-containing protein [Holophagales bacterium]
MFRVLLVASALVSALAAAQPCASPSFALPVDLGIPVDDLSWLQAADVDGDGREDLLLHVGSGRVDVLWNRADGLARGPSTELAVDPRDSAYGMTAELDGDGRADLFVRAKRGEPSSWRFESWLGDGSGRFAMAASVPFDAEAELDLILVRVDGSAFADVLSLSHAASDASKLQVRRWRGRGDGTFQAPTTTLTLDDPYFGLGGTFFSASHDVVAGDVDGDGRTDLVVTSGAVYSSGFSYASSLWLGDGVGGYSRSDPAPSRRASELVDVDGDGRDEVLYSEQQKTRDVGILRREADGTWREIARFSPAGSVLLGELDRDPTRLEALVAEGVLGAYRLADSGPVRFATIPALSSATLLDLDGDGHLDVLGVAPRPTGAPGRLVLARNVCGQGPGTATLFLPAFLSLTGAEATRFETEVAVTNFGASAVSAVLRLHPAGDAPVVDLASFRLEQGRVRLFSTTDDAEAQRIALPAGVDRGTATLEVSTQEGSPPDVAVDLRVLSQRPGSGRGGVGFRARPAEGHRVGTTGELAWLKEDVEDRTNLAVASAGPDPVTLRVSVFSTDPDRPGRVTLPDTTLAPYGSYQWNRVLAAAGLGARSGWARVERLAGGPWTAWATVNSNGTGDGSVVEASAAESGTLLPAIVGTDRYRTDVVLTNPAATSRTAKLRFPPVSGESPLALDVEVEAGSSRLVDPVAALRHALLIPPVPYVGHAAVESSFVVGARVSTAASPASGSFGVYTPTALFTYADSVLVSGLRQDGRNRSNLAIVVGNVTAPSQFRVELFDGRTGTLARTIERVEAGINYGAPSRFQLDSILWGTGIPFGWARVVQTTGWSPFFAYAVVNDGAAPGLGSGDGTYLPGISR